MDVSSSYRDFTRTRPSRFARRHRLSVGGSSAHLGVGHLLLPAPLVRGGGGGGEGGGGDKKHGAFVLLSAIAKAIKILEISQIPGFSRVPGTPGFPEFGGVGGTNKFVGLPGFREFLCSPDSRILRIPGIS